MRDLGYFKEDAATDRKVNFFSDNRISDMGSQKAYSCKNPQLFVPLHLRLDIFLSVYAVDPWSNFNTWTTPSPYIHHVNKQSHVVSFT